MSFAPGLKFLIVVNREIGAMDLLFIIPCRLYGDSWPLDSLASFLSEKRIRFTEATKQNFAPYKVGDTFGPTYVIL